MRGDGSRAASVPGAEPEDDDRRHDQRRGDQRQLEPTAQHGGRYRPARVSAGAPTSVAQYGQTPQPRRRLRSHPVQRRANWVLQ